MKSLNLKITALLALLAVAFMVDMPASARSPKWKKVWTENFDGPTLNNDVWGFMDRRNDLTRNYNTSNQAVYEIKNGKLIIKAIRNTVLPNDTAKYLTGSVVTRFRKAFAPGRIEVRAKINPKIGAFPAIWLLPFKENKGWPADGEIDMMEQNNLSDEVSQVVHSAYTHAHPNAAPMRYVYEKINTRVYNTYRVDILEDRLDFYINGRKTLTYPKVASLQGEDQFPFYHDWYLILCMQLHSKNISKINPSDFPFTLEVDWVKYYQLK